MHIKRIALYLMVVMSQIHAGDLQIYSSRGGVARVDVDMSPAGFMHRRMLAEMRHKPDNKASLQESYSFNPYVKGWMDQYEMGDYYEHFHTLAASTLDQKEQLADELIMIPFFTRLQDKSQVEQYALLKELSDVAVLLDFNYDILRLFYAAIANVVDLRGMQNGFPLYAALCNEDSILVQRLLAEGMDPNISYDGSYPLMWCHSKKDAQLLIRYGASVKDQHQSKDLINHLLVGPSLDEKEVDLMRYFAQLTLPYCNRNTAIELHKFIHHQLRRYNQVDLSVAGKKLELLLELGYNRSRSSVLDSINGKKIGKLPTSRMKAILKKRAFARAKSLFKNYTNDHFDIKQDIVLRVLKRSIHGGKYHTKPLRIKKEVLECNDRSEVHDHVDKYAFDFILNP